MSLEVMFEGVK